MMKVPAKGIGKCYCKSKFAVTFGLGLVIACFCPTQLSLFLAGIIIAALGIAVARRTI